MESLEQMLYITFNQDSSCFAVGTEKGFKVFSTYPFKENFERGFYFIIINSFRWWNRNS
jgi:hypothetical protein